MNAAWRGMLMAALALLACGCDAPGEGRVAEAGKARCTVIDAAVAGYRRAHDDYPVNADELDDYGLPPPQAGDPRITYTRLGTRRYQLEFSYSGPGRNRCQRTSDVGAVWDCWGYY